MNKNLKNIIVVLVMVFVFFGILLLIINLVKIDNPLIDDKEMKNIINLSTYNKDVLIEKGGEYTLTGTLKNYSVIINASNEEVKLNLMSANINSLNNSGIIGKSVKKLIINLVEGTENEIASNSIDSIKAAIDTVGDIVIDGKGVLKLNSLEGENIAILSESNIIINNGIIKVASDGDAFVTKGETGDIIINEGNIYIVSNKTGLNSTKSIKINGGSLNITSSEEKGFYSIKSKEGYEINGGTVVATGTDMIECPSDNSMQKSLCLKFQNLYEKNSLVTLQNDKDELILGVKPEKRTKNIIISSKTLIEGAYKIYIDGSISATLKNGIYENGNFSSGRQIKAGNDYSLIVSNNVNKYGIE